MREGTTKHKQILGISLYHTTVGKLRKDLEEYAEYSDYLPHIIDENGHIIYADDWQAKEEWSDNIEIIEIHKEYADEYLKEEISAIGMEDVFQDYDWRPLIQKLKIQKRGELLIYDTQRIVVDVIYHTSADYYSGGYDCESEIEVIGYMNENLQIIAI